MIASFRTNLFVVIATDLRMSWSYAMFRHPVSRRSEWRTGNQRTVDVRAGQRGNSADLRRAGRERLRSRDERLIPLRGRRPTGRASTGEGIAVGVRRGEAVRERLQERDDLVLLLIRQAEIAGRTVEVLRDLRPGPAVHFLGRSRRTVSGGDIERIEIARIVEVHELLQALDVPIVEEPLLEEGPRRLGGTPWRCHRRVARRHHLELAVDTRGKLCPVRVRVGGGAEPASEALPQSKVPIAKSDGIGGEPRAIQ